MGLNEPKMRYGGCFMAGFWRKLIKSAVEDHEYGELNKAEETDLKSAGHVRRHYVITGRVQEVGFRYTAFYIAEELHLSGWVSNLDDGTCGKRYEQRTAGNL